MSARLPDHDAREAIRNDLGATLVVEAAAGTGKTTELVARMLALVSTGTAELARIVAVTFTEKAAGEMKLRLRASVEEARVRPGVSAAELRNLDLALQQLEQAHISTIHGFCADLLRERPIEAAVDPMFEMAADDDRERIFDEAFDDWFQKQLEAPGEGVRRVLRRRSRDRDATGPREALRKAGLDLIDQRDFGAPWTAVPMDREGDMDALLVSLGELGALAAQSAGGEDWLQKGLAEVARFMEELGRRERVRGERDHDGLEAELRELGKKRSWGWKGYGKNYGKGILRSDVLDQRARVKGQLDRVLADLDASLAALLHAEMRPLVASYEALKGRAGKLDFLDLLVRARDLLATNDQVRADMQARFTHLLVDEFQDTDPLQAEILVLLASNDPAVADHKKVTVVPGKLFVVGDPKQSIYRFRRADVALYERTKKRLVEQGAKVVHLVTSFRASPAIQRFVNDAFARVMKGGEDGSQASYVGLEAPPGRMDSQDRPSIVALPVPRPYGDYGKIATWKVDESLPDTVGAFVEWLVKKSGWTITERGSDVPRPIEARHVCLLFKRFSSFGEDKTRAYVRALEARSIPHVLMGGRSYHAREEVLALRNALGAIEWPDDELSVFATLRGPFFALGDDVLLAYRDRTGPLHLLREVKREDLEPPLAEAWDAIAILRDLHFRRNRRPIADTLARLLGETRAHAGVAIWPTGEQALANILRVLDLARRFEASAATSFRAFVQRMQDEASRGGAPEAPVVEEGTDGVRLMTVHRAKGLEFPVVIVVDPLAPKTMREPSRYTEPDAKLCAMPLCGCTPRDLDLHRTEVLRRDHDEAVRLGYVAATRARDLLVVPAFGDGPQEGWLDMLDVVLYPDPRDLRVSHPAPGCPPFAGTDTVLEWPDKAQRSTEGAVMPGLHTSRGGHRVVWWDPTALELGKENEAGLRQRKLLEADKEGKAAEDGVKQHQAWKDARDRRLTLGGVPELDVRTVTDAAPDRVKDVGAAKVELVTVPARREGRPHHKRFGTLVHAVLAEVPLDASPAAVEKIAAKQARLVGAPEDEASAAAAAASDALAHPLMRRAAASRACRREVFVSLTEDDGALVEGVVDLAFEEDGVWVVVDYKTDRELSAGGQERYEAQVATYAAAIARATGASARGVLFRV